MSLALLRMMNWMQTKVAEIRSGESGQGLVEYALIIALVAVVVIVAIVALRQQISNIFYHVSNCLNTPSGCSS